MLTGDNGIINKAIEARDATEIAGIVEEIKMAILEKQMENLGSLTSDDLRDVLKEYFTGVPETLPEDETELAELELTTIDGKYMIKVGDIWQGSLSVDLTKLPTAEETVPYLPNSNFIKVLGTDLSTGLVIEDNVGNQYVWIEVPRTAMVYPTAGTEITEGSDGKFTDEEYTTIEEDLHTYTITYRNGTSYADTWSSEEQTGLTENEYNNLKQTMLQSIYENGGFWIGRYEAGIEYNRTGYTTINESSAVPISKADKYPYNYIYCNEAQFLSSKVNTGEYTSSLMFGVQWDLVLKYLETKGVDVAELKDNSTSWGNNYNNTYNITNTLAKYSFNDGRKWDNAPYNKTEYERILLTTGASDTFSKQNIYDLAGNVSEWTLECYSDNASVYRGGYCNGYGSGRTVSDRYTYDATEYFYDYGRFSCFYILRYLKSKVM